MFLSDYVNAGCKGHKNFNFVDVNLEKDNKLFIDPILLELARDKWSAKANLHVESFFDCLFESINSRKSHDLYEHAHEQNATKLGYGNGYNGKGNTPEGMKKVFKDLENVKFNIPTIKRVVDIPIFVEGFAEDGMSDLLTNILHECLNEFTAREMKKYGIKSTGKQTFWTWDAISRKWVEVMKDSWHYNGKEILMVPKWVVRNRYLFRVEQYLSTVIAERIRTERGLDDLTKKDIIDDLPRKSEHWRYENAVEYSEKHPDALEEYHARIPKYYGRKGGIMQDKDLDDEIYKA